MNGINIWDLNTRKVKQVIPSAFSLGKIGDNKLVRVYDTCIYGAHNSKITTWQINNVDGVDVAATGQKGQAKMQIMSKHAGKIEDIQIDSMNIYSAAREIKIWDRETGQETGKMSVPGSYAVNKILIKPGMIFCLANHQHFFRYDLRTGNCIDKFFQQTTRFYSLDQNNENDLLAGTYGGIYSCDFKNGVLCPKFRTQCPTEIHSFAAYGDYIFSQSANSMDHEDDNEVVEIFNKNGHSLGTLKYNTYHFRLGDQEKLKKLQASDGVLYVNSYYTGRGGFMRDLFGTVPSMIKCWDFNP